MCNPSNLARWAINGGIATFALISIGCIAGSIAAAIFQEGGLQ
jgi:hypothetical protein